jgi:hypothetical protein
MSLADRQRRVCLRRSRPSRYHHGGELEAEYSEPRRPTGNLQRSVVKPAGRAVVLDTSAVPELSAAADEVPSAAPTHRPRPPVGSVPVPSSSRPCRRAKCQQAVASRIQ